MRRCYDFTRTEVALTLLPFALTLSIVPLRLHTRGSLSHRRLLASRGRPTAASNPEGDQRLRPLQGSGKGERGQGAIQILEQFSETGRGSRPRCDRGRPPFSAAPETPPRGNAPKPTTTTESFRERHPRARVPRTRGGAHGRGGPKRARSSEVRVCRGLPECVLISETPAPGTPHTAPCISSPGLDNWLDRPQSTSLNYTHLPLSLPLWTFGVRG